MGLREKINDSPKLTAAVVICLILIGVVTAYFQFAQGKNGKAPSEFYYTTDDGQTFFAHPVQIPPFDYQGKPAVRAHVYECGGQRFVAYMERYTPKARDLLVSLQSGKPVNPPVNAAMINNAQTVEHEFKKPGEKSWVKMTDFRAIGEVQRVVCPDGKSGTPRLVD